MHEFAVEKRQEAHLDHDLKAVADPDDEIAGGDELFDVLAEPLAKTVGDDLSRGDVVAEGESAGDREDVVLVEELRRRDQIVEMDSSRARAGTLEGRLGFGFAVDAEARKYQCLYVNALFVNPFAGLYHASGSCHAFLSSAIDRSIRGAFFPPSRNVSSSVTRPSRATAAPSSASSKASTFVG